MTLDDIRSNRPVQMGLALLFGIVFGFLLVRGGATHHAVIWGQLLLYDFTVVKIMLSAVLVGMVGFQILRSLGLARAHVAPPTLGTHLVGGLIFGLGFGLLGLCPGTVGGAIGRGSIDALIGGGLGLLIGTFLFALVYPRVERGIAKVGPLRWKTLPDLLGGVNPWVVVIPMGVLILAVFWVLESLRL
ncbi:MAG TPA: YeeE/YedE thiosulfate transporter family protein [Methanoregulaceae archaeon]|mgnify:CR=1 FL=1|nr:YeeE/YedE thiosulfate transporter family protein [Methanoregulaceae archaeon]HQJ87012.1 YeeE/YedE thiosulfate transporter family protein [Methanoregulaceae archaeon]